MIVQGDFCSRGHLSMGDVCPRKLLYKEAFWYDKLAQISFSSSLMKTHINSNRNWKNIVNRFLVYRNLFLGQKSPWTNVPHGQMSPWTKVSLDNHPLDNCRLDKCLLGLLSPHRLLESELNAVHTWMCCIGPVFLSLVSTGGATISIVFLTVFSSPVLVSIWCHLCILSWYG